MKHSTAAQDQLLALDSEQISADAFRSLFSSHPGPVAIVTAMGEDKPVGFTATSVISLAAEPPTLAFSVSSTSSSFATMQTAEYAAVHFLDAADHELARRFATSGIDRFADLDTEPLPDGTPLLLGVHTWSWGRITQRVKVNGSTLIIMQMNLSATAETRTPLIYHDRLYSQPGALSN